MKCELCNDNIASVVLFVLDKEEKLEKTFYLCEFCANKVPVSCLVMNQNQPSPTIKKFSLPKEISENTPGLSCSYCLTTVEEFLKSGLLGCSHCYEAFRGIIRDLMVGKQPELIHRGKKPVRLNRRIKIEKDINQMRQIYQKCLEEENYEKASGVIQRLKRLESYLR
ncbi:MAG: hypothetical protein KBG67_02265 [Candidatus Atribacteria bacterium]|nr:hypothetical protein [Candidatus Atribacteria bacterium]